jgi:hypothetical protein
MKTRMARVQGQARFEARERGERNEFTASQRAEYGRAMRDLRASYGMTDGLKLSQGEFHAYLERRRAEDARARGWG